MPVLPVDGGPSSCEVHDQAPFQRLFFASRTVSLMPARFPDFSVGGFLFSPDA